MSKPCESICVKCGGSDLYLLFRPANSRYKTEIYGISGNRFASASSWLASVYRDHIDYTCRTCRFRWQGLPMKKPRKAKTADSLQEASDA